MRVTRFRADGRSGSCRPRAHSFVTRFPGTRRCCCGSKANSWWTPSRWPSRRRRVPSRLLASKARGRQRFRLGSRTDAVGGSEQSTTWKASSGFPPSVDRLRVAAHDERLVDRLLALVLLLDLAQEGHHLRLLRVPVRDLLDQAAALRLRGVQRGHRALPLVVAAGPRRRRRRRPAAEGEEARAQPFCVAVLDVGQATQRARRLRVAGALGVRAQQRGLRGLGAVVLAQVREQVARGTFGPEQAREEPHAREARTGRSAASQAIPFVPDFRYKSHEEVRHRMARITVEDCLEHVPNRFELVLLAARRAKQLLKGARPLVESDNKEIVSALREIAAGKVRLQYSG